MRSVLHQRDLLHTALQDLHHCLQLMDTLQNKALEETGPFQSSEIPQPLSQQLHTERQPFVLKLDAHGFSPEELSVVKVDRTLSARGMAEKKQEENGRSSYTVQECTQELSLPKGVSPEKLHRYLSADRTRGIQDTPNTCDTERTAPQGSGGGQAETGQQ